MKKQLLSLILLLAPVFASAQTIYICKDGAYTAKEITDYLEISPSEADSITFDVPKFPAPVVTINYSGSTATVNIPAYASYITSSVDGAKVTICNSQSDGEEATYVVSGSSNNGSLSIYGKYKMSVTLDNLTLTSADSAAINIQCGKRIAMKLDGLNTLADAAGGSQKACLYSKGHLEMSGEGVLNITGNAAHALASKEYLELKSSLGAINIIKAAKDAIHCGQYFEMKGGAITIDSNTAGDGIQTEYVLLDDDVTPDPEKEDNGKMFFKGGTLNITIANEDCKAIKSDSDIAISGGTFTINANGNGSRGIQTDGNMVIGEENATTSITITAAGGKCTQEECSDDPHKCMGIKLDGDLTINAGTITVYNTGKKSKGIKVGGTYTLNGGTVVGEVE